MPELRDVIERLRRGQSIRSIQKETGTHRQTIRELRELARSHGWLEADNFNAPSEAEIEEARNAAKAASERPHGLDRHRPEIERWIAEGYSYTVMHRLLAERYECDESTLRRYIHREFPRNPKVVLRRTTKPGETMDVDFGTLGRVVDDHGAIRKAHVFSGRLRHSRHAYREVTLTQNQEAFTAGHIHAFEYFGGVPEKTAPDNLKAAVIRASLHEPLLNRVYRSLAEYYGFLINPCKPYTPEHKGGVENDVKYIKRNFWPQFVERERQRGYAIPRFSKLQSALDEWNTNVASVREIRGVGRSPIVIFETEERAALRPLPAARWDRPVWKLCKVHRDATVQFQRAYYSVPYRLVGQSVQVCGNALHVLIFQDFLEITRHPRARCEWQYVRREEHLPADRNRFLRFDRNSTLHEALALGVDVRAVAEAIFSDRALDGLRPARALLNLAKRFPRERVMLACRRALRFGTPSYRSVKAILEQGLDAEERTAIVDERQQIRFRFARPDGFFNQ